MKSITARQLRAQLEETIDDVLNGQDVVVTYRSKKPVRLTSFEPGVSDKKQLAGLASFDNAPKKAPKFDTSLPLKELYNRSLQQKYDKK